MADEIDSQKNIGLGIIFTTSFADAIKGIDAFRDKLKALNQELGASKKTQDDAIKAEKEAAEAKAKAAKAADELAKAQAALAEKNKVAAASTKRNTQEQDLLSQRLAKVTGESPRFIKAVEDIHKMAGTSAIRWRDLYGAITSAESRILHTEKSMFRSAKAAKEWSSQVDLAKVAHSFLNQQMIKANGILLDSRLSTERINKEKSKLADTYQNLGNEGKNLVGRLGLEIKTLKDLEFALKKLNQTNALRNSGMIVANKVIEYHRSAMNQLKQDGDAWEATVNRNAVANAFLKDQVIRVGNAYLSSKKTSAELSNELNYLRQRYAHLGEAVNFVTGQFGNTIRTLPKLKETLRALSEEQDKNIASDKRFVSQRERLLAMQKRTQDVAKDLVAELKNGNISWEAAVAKMRAAEDQARKVENTNKALAGNVKKFKDELAEYGRKFGDLDRIHHSFRRGFAQLESAVARGSMSFVQAKDKLKELFGLYESNRSGVGKLRQEYALMSAEEKKLALTGGELSGRQGFLRVTTKDLRNVVEHLNQQILYNGRSLEWAKTKLAELAKVTKEKTSADAFARKELHGLGRDLITGASAAGLATPYFVKLGTAIRSLAAWIPAAIIIGGVIKSFQEATQAVVDYDQALKNLQAITTATDAETELMGRKMVEVSKKTGYSAKEVADAMVFIGQAGFSASESIATIEATANLAQGTLEKMGTSAHLVTTALRVFNIDALESGRVADIFANAANKSKTDIEGLKVAFNYLGPVAKAAGFTLEESAAAVMALANAGIRASTQGTSLRQVISRLENPSAKLKQAFKEAAPELEKAGLSMNDLKTKTDKLATTAELLSKIVGDDTAKAFKLFELRGANAALVLSRLGREGVEFLLSQVTEMNSAHRMAQTQIEGVSLAYKNLRNVIQSVGIALGESGLLTPVRLLISGLKSIVETLGDLIGNRIGASILLFSTFSVAILGVYRALKYATFQLILFFTTLTSAELLARVRDIGVFRLALEELGVMIRHVTLYLGTLRVVFTATAAQAGKLAGVLAVLRSVMISLWVVIRTHPIAVIITALGALLTTYTMLTAWQKRYTTELGVAALEHSRNVKTLEYYKNMLMSTTKGSIEYDRALNLLVTSFPSLSKAIYDNKMSMEDRGKAIDELIKKEEKLSKSKTDEYLSRLAVEYSKVRRESEFYIASLDMGSISTTLVAIHTLTADSYTLADSWLFAKLAWNKLFSGDSGAKYTQEQIEKLKGATQSLVEQWASALHEARKSREEMKKAVPVELQSRVLGAVKAFEVFEMMMKQQGESAVEYYQEFGAFISELDDRWVRFYASQDALGKSFVLKQAKNLKTELEELDKNTDAKAKLSKGYANRRQAIMDEHYRKMLKAADSFYQAGDSLLKENFNRELANIKNVYEAKKAALDQTLSLDNLAITQSEKIDQAVVDKKREIFRKYHEDHKLLVESQSLAELAVVRATEEKRKALILSSFASIDEKHRVRLEKKVEAEALKETISIYEGRLTAYKSMASKMLDTMSMFSQQEVDIIKAIFDTEKRLLDDDFEARKVHHQRVLESRIIDNNLLAKNEGERFNNELSIWKEHFSRLRGLSQIDLSYQLELISRREASLKKALSNQLTSEQEYHQRLSEIERDTASAQIVAYSKSLDMYRDIMSKKIGEVTRWAEVAKQAADKARMAELSGADKLREMNRRTLNEREQQADIEKQIREKYTLASEYLYKREYDKAQQVYQDIENLIGQVVEYQSGKAGTLEENEKKTIEKRMELQKVLNEAIVDGHKNQEKYAKSNMDTAESEYNQAKRDYDSITSRVQELNTIYVEAENKKVEATRKMRTDVEVEYKSLLTTITEITEQIKSATQLKASLDISEVRSALDELKGTLFGDKLEAVISFFGEGSTKAPLSDKVVSLKAELGSLFDLAKSGVTVKFDFVSGSNPITTILDNLKAAFGFKDKLLQFDFTAFTNALSYINGVFSSVSPATWFESVQNNLKALVNTIGEVFAKLTELGRSFVTEWSIVLYGYDLLVDAYNKLKELDGKTIHTTHVITTVHSGGAPAENSTPVMKATDGGVVPGSGDSDSVPALVTPGEFIVRKSAVQRYGESLFHSLNNMALRWSSLTPKFAVGGLVPRMSAPSGTKDPIQNLHVIELNINSEKHRLYGEQNQAEKLTKTLRRLQMTTV